MPVIIPILLFLSAFGFIALRHFYSLKEDAPGLENQEQNLLRELKKEKIAFQQLNSRNARLRAYLKSSHKRLNKSFAVIGKLEKIEEDLDKLKAQYSILKAENNSLLEERNRLAKENEALRVKLDSSQRPQEPVKEVKKEVKAGVKAEGNRGVLFQTKQPTSSPRVTIEVIPASGQRQ